MPFAQATVATNKRNTLWFESLETEIKSQQCKIQMISHSRKFYYKNCENKVLFQ